MSENPSHHGPDKIAIPLPDTIRDMFLRLDANNQYVSHKVPNKGEDNEGEEQPLRLKTEDHAFYIGKVIPPATSEKVQKLMGWGNPNGHIYTKEFITGALDFMFSHLEEGQKARFVVAPSLSELFNGPEDVKKAMLPEDEIVLIKKIARKQFKKRKNDIEVVDIEEDPLHQELFNQLHASVNFETGLVNIEEALGMQEDEEIELGPQSNSLDIARKLYKTVQQGLAEDDDRLASAFKHAVPARLRESDNANSAREHYALVEVAIRLTDILHGRFIHGGVDRQGVYDEIITKIIKGENGGYRNIKALYDLFELFKGKRFETLHLKTKENYYALKKMRSIARTRFGLFAVLALLLGGGLVQTGMQMEKRKEQKREQMITDDLEEALADVAFFMDGPHVEIDKSHNLEIFNGIIEKSLKDIGNRYYLSPDTLEDLRPLLQKYFLEHKDALNDIYQGNHFRRIDHEDRFVHEYNLFFTDKGMQLGRPYEHLYANLDDFQALLDSDEDIVVDDRDTQATSGRNEWGVPRKQFNFIGVFYSGEFSYADGGYNMYEFYWHIDKQGRKFLVAKEGIDTYGEWINAAQASHEVKREYTIYSTQRAREGIRQFLYAIRRYDALPLEKHQGFMWELINRFDDPDRLCKGGAEKAVTIDIMGSKEGEYVDFFGQFSFEFAIDSVYEKETGRLERCLFARRPGEDEFTDEAAAEMMKIYDDVTSARRNYSLGTYIEDQLPLDFNAINSEVDHISSRLDEIETMLSSEGLYDKRYNEKIGYIRREIELLRNEISQWNGSYESNSNIIRYLDSLRRSWSSFEEGL
ncbi:hypothetical protein KJ742_00585 [Patescibacteria group bacterium]|nr:hypothetical protein [Patescibacteria group bacterium]MBU1682420.1 hypothetical protein [Patescibacteria group bacterium]MBU1935104.1 hypothetical protein [Patescibacteria group bacterium]